MNKKSLFAVWVLAGILVLAGCSKNNTPSFSWTYGYYSNNADSAFSPAPTYAAPIANSCIDAYASGQYMQIAAGTKLSVGTYPIYTSSSSAYMIYYSNSVIENSKSGTIKVSYNDGSKMSGSFNATFTDGTTISGSFSNIPIR